MLTADYLRMGLQTNTYDYLDNSPADIRQAVIDMIEVVRGREHRSGAQRGFKERLTELGREGTPEWTGLDGIGFASHPRGTVSRSFAEKYFVGSPALSSHK